MTGIVPLIRPAAEASSRPSDRATAAVVRTQRETKQEAAALVRLIEATGEAGKGRFVDYRA